MTRLAGLALALVLFTACSGGAETLDAAPSPVDDHAVSLDVSSSAPEITADDGPTDRQRRARALRHASEVAALQAKKDKQAKQRKRARAGRRAAAGVAVARNPLAGRTWGLPGPS